MKKAHLNYVYQLLREVKLRGLPRSRLISYVGIRYGLGQVMIDKLIKYGFMKTIFEGRSKIMRTTPSGASLLDDITKLYDTLEMIN